MTLGVSRETGIGIAVSAIAVVAMVFEHVLDGDPSPEAFLLSAGLSLALAAVVFGRIVPRVKEAPDVAVRAAKRGVVIGVLSVLSLALLWLGLPYPLAGGALSLGLLGRGGERRRLAAVAIVVGVVVLLVGVVYLADVVVNAQL